MCALTEALAGHLDAGHAQLMGSMLHRVQLGESALAELYAVIATTAGRGRTSWSYCRPFPVWT